MVAIGRLIGLVKRLWKRSTIYVTNVTRKRLWFGYFVNPGPFLSRFDRFLLIGPRAPSTYQSKLHFLSKLLVYSACAGLSVFEVALRDRNCSHIFPTFSQNIL